MMELFHGMATLGALNGGSVKLERLTMSHLAALCDVGLTDELWKLTVTSVRSSDEMKQYLEDAIRQRDTGSAFPFVIGDAQTGRVLGSTRFGNIDRINRRVEIGWTWIGMEWQRTIVNTEAKYLLLRYAFELLQCVRVEFKTDALNTRSRAALLRIGAKEEGILRRHTLMHDGRFRDTVYYSILADEWPTVRKELEAKGARYNGVTHRDQ